MLSCSLLLRSYGIKRSHLKIILYINIYFSIARLSISAIEDAQGYGYFYLRTTSNFLLGVCLSDDLQV